MENWMHVNVWNLGILKIQGSYLCTQHFTKKSPGISGRIPSKFLGVSTHQNDRIFPFFHAKNRPPPICLPPSLPAMFRHSEHSEARLSAVSTAKPKKTAAAAAAPCVTRGVNRLVNRRSAELMGFHRKIVAQEITKPEIRRKTMENLQ